MNPQIQDLADQHQRDERRGDGDLATMRALHALFEQADALLATQRIPPEALLPCAVAHLTDNGCNLERTREMVGELLDDVTELAAMGAAERLALVSSIQRLN